MALVRAGVVVGAGEAVWCQRARTAHRSASARRLPKTNWYGVVAGLLVNASMRRPT
ncbi:hypothetical protein ABT147_39705 [Streptomyces sp. NPDC001868]|uniref:hypothetical protein n=1 Tax=Streptomyces sp. NPDC001868 TaxID=3154401 RepID=UPI0033336EB8